MNPKESRLKHLLSVLAPIGVRHWERYGISRLYINIPLTFELADLDVPSVDEDTKFYLDLHKLTWHLTGEQEVDDVLIQALNELADCGALTKVYDRLHAIQAVKNVKVSELANMSDSELIALVQDDLTDDNDRLVWADKISEVPDLSIEVIDAIMAADSDWFSNELLLNQKNLPEDVWMKACLAPNPSWRLMQFLATNSVDAKILRVIARKGDYNAFYCLERNKASDFHTLLIIAHKGYFNERVLLHPDMTDTILAGLVWSSKTSEGMMSTIATVLKNPGPSTMKAIKSVEDGKCRLALVKGARFLDAECLDLFSRGATLPLAIAILKHDRVSAETARTFVNDKRARVAAAASRALDEMQ